MVLNLWCRVLGMEMTCSQFHPPELVSGVWNTVTRFLTVMGAFAEFERALIRERQREGIEPAKKRGADPSHLSRISSPAEFP
jgi:hypothetical protein